MRSQTAVFAGKTPPLLAWTWTPSRAHRLPVREISCRGKLVTTGAKIAWGIGGFLLLTRSNALSGLSGPPIGQRRSSSPQMAANNANLNSLLNNLLKAIGGGSKSAGGKSGGANPSGGAGSGRSPGSSSALGSVEDSFATFDNLSGPATLQPQADAIAAAQAADVPPPDLSIGVPDSSDLSALGDLAAAPDVAAATPQFDPGVIDAAAFDSSALDSGAFSGGDVGPVDAGATFEVGL